MLLAAVTDIQRYDALFVLQLVGRRHVPSPVA
jgi:hypothetical protein